jgi:hypothetical protein
MTDLSTTYLGLKLKKPDRRFSISLSKKIDRAQETG